MKRRARKVLSKGVGISPSNVLLHELIGLEAEVAESKNRCQVGIKGRIIDETMKTILLETPKGRKRVFKSDVKLLLKLPDGSLVLVDGKELLGRPEDRIKKKLRNW
ncbi:MAG: ribonuclease P protein component 1 [Thermofilaceae archaeon]